MSVILKTVHFLKLKYPEQLWLLLLFPFSALVQLAVHKCPFRWLTLILGDSGPERKVSDMASEDQIRLAARIGRTARRVAQHTPWQSECLVQAMCTVMLLRIYKVPYLVSIGLKRSTAGDNTSRSTLHGHAWVSVGSSIICGASEYQSYAVVNTFVPPSKGDNLIANHYSTNQAKR